MLAYSDNADRITLATMSETMQQEFGLIRRPWGVYYLKNKITGEAFTRENARVWGIFQKI